jgi:hypothetical protein
LLVLKWLGIDTKLKSIYAVGSLRSFFIALLQISLLIEVSNFKIVQVMEKVKFVETEQGQLEVLYLGY